MRVRLLSLITLGLLAVPMLASANNLYDWSYTDGGANVGSGTFVTTSSGSPFTVLSISGVADGSAILGPPSPYAGADNLLFVPPTASPGFVDDGGISFTTTGDTYNIGGDFAGQYVLNIATLNPVGYPPPAPGSYYIRFSVSQVPEPATLALLGLGLAGIGFSRRRRTG